MILYNKKHYNAIKGVNSMEKNLFPRPEHPQPMFKRDNWQNLNGEWLFEFDFGTSGAERRLFKPESAEEYTKKIKVPFCPESELSGIGYKDFIPAVWYKRSITVTEEQLKGRVLLHFGAVDYECDVYINGEKAGSHFGSYSSFTLDITDLLKAGENDLTVNARDNVRSGKQPKGKQSSAFYSQGCDYTRTTGIWQTVWLEYVPAGYIKIAKYYPDIEEAAFDIELTLSLGGKLTVEALYEGKNVGGCTKEIKGRYARFRLPLTEKHLWEVGNGRLYDLKFTLETDYGTDVLYSYAGLREVRIDGFKVLINGKSIFQRTVLDQGYYPDGIYTAPSDEDLKRDIEMSMKIGFNGARLHEKIFEPRFLYHCDKAGYLVWGEHANWGLDINNEGGLLNFLPEWCETVERDFNHPAIIGWCPFNETWNQFGTTARRILRSVYEETNRLDHTRPVIDTSGGYHVITDVYDQHDYDQNPENFRKSYADYNGKADSFKLLYKNDQIYIPDLPLFMSEFGGIKWIPESKQKNAASNSWGYGNAPSTEEEFLARYEGLVSALLEAPNIMGFCYTQLYDVEQEVNGLYTYSREKKFDDYSRITAANRKKAAIEE